MTSLTKALNIVSNRALNIVSNNFISNNLEQKANNDFDKNLSLYEFLFQNAHFDLSNHLALRYYTICAPVYSAVDLIANEVATIQPVLINTSKTDKEFITDHPLLELLKFPNADSTYHEFMYRKAAFYILTGNNFDNATGNVDLPPLELYSLNPQRVAITPNIIDRFPEEMIYSYTTAIIFKRNEIKNRFRFYNDLKTSELWQVKTFNPSAHTNSLYGLSQLNSIYYEIEQYLKTSMHNLSLLNYGGRPTGALISDSRLSEDQLQELKAELNRYHEGANNAGRMFILQGEDLKFQEMGSSTRDMDFREMKSQVTSMIYNVLRIPLPLISEERMTMRNMENARLNFYYNAVLPLVKRFFSEFTNFLLSRYPNSENLIVTYDDSEIPALEPQRNEELQKLQSLGVLTINELRKKVGYEALDGGDDIYAPATNIPIAHDVETDNKLTTRENFRRLMQQQIDEEGHQRYSDEDIERIANRNGL